MKSWILIVRQINDLKKRIEEGQSLSSNETNENLCAIFTIEVEQLKSRVISRDRTITILKEQLEKLKPKGKKNV